MTILQDTVAPTTRSPLLKREMPGLDVLRGIAILAVFLGHCLYWDIPHAPPQGSIAAHITSALSTGWLGVFLFFVLSGFLITGNLLDGKPKPHFMRNFYYRRALRILPPFVLTLVVIKAFAGAKWPYVFLCMAYAANLAEMLHLSGYIYPLLWSLAVEEQFYLVWPWLAKFLSRRHFGYVAAASVVLSPLLRYLSAAGLVPMGDPHTMTWLISDNLAMGAVLAIFLRSSHATQKNVKRLTWSLALVGFTLLAIGIKFRLLNRHSPFGSAIETVPFEFLFASLLLVSLMIGDRPQILFWTRPLRFFGYISYGLYLYHLIVFQFADLVLVKVVSYQTWNAGFWLLRFFGVGSVAVLISYLSRRYLEEFFLRQKHRLAS